jgi:transcription elongation factor GreA
MTMERVPMTI